MKKGDIYWSLDTEHNPHPIIFLRYDGKENFEGAIISTKGVQGNIPMKDEYFEQVDKLGKQYKIQNAPSYLVRDKYIKITLQTNDKVVGRLTDEGIKFVESNLKDLKSHYFPCPVWESVEKADEE